MNHIEKKNEPLISQLRAIEQGPHPEGISCQLDFKDPDMELLYHMIGHISSVKIPCWLMIRSGILLSNILGIIVIQEWESQS